MTHRRINLLPPEREQRRRARQITTTIVAAGVALVVLRGLVLVAELVRLHGQKNALQSQQATNSTLQSQIGQLSQFQQLDSQLQQKTTLLNNITKDEVRWSIVLADVSLVIPSDTWLTNFTATQATTSATQSGAGAQANPAIGTIQLTWTTFSHLHFPKQPQRLTPLH